MMEAELTFHLAVFAAEGLFGEAQVRMDVTYDIDKHNRSLVVDSTTDVGLTVVKIYTALALREFGDNSLLVRRAPKIAPKPLNRPRRAHPRAHPKRTERAPKAH